MNDFSDVLYLTVAMVIFSMLTVNTARSFLNTSDTVIRSDVEYKAIVRAQDEIDEVKLITADDRNTLNPASIYYRYDNHPITVTESYGPNDEYSDTYTINASSKYIDENDPNVRRYLVTVNLSNNAVEPAVNVTLTYVKSFAR